MKKNIHFGLNLFITHFTLARILGALFTALIVAGLKYYISGSLQIEWGEFWNNVSVAIFGWTFNTGVIAWLTNYLGIKGVNFNLKQFLYGFDTVSIGQGSSVENFKPKLYNAMDSLEDYNINKGLDKGKGIETETKAEYNSAKNSGITGTSGEGLNENKQLYKGKDIVKVVLDYFPPVESYRAAWFRTFPDLDPASVFFPKKTNPGPGFNVPGGEVPIQDDICKHIDYNTHILSQLKKMDLETALEQINNNIMFIKVMDNKLDFARNALSKIPTIPTTEYEFKLKNQILRDLDKLSLDKVRAEARTTLLSSRIQFIESQISKK